MKNYRVVLFIGIIEILIGGITLIGVLGSLVLSLNQKTPNVLFFVIVTGLTSTLLGVGLLKFKQRAYRLLVYFSSVIFLTKLLIFTQIIHLNGALETVIPGPVKNGISMLYHGFIIYYLKKPGIKQIFHK